MHPGQEGLRPVKPPRQDGVTCNKCKQYSGWSHIDLSYIVVTEEISLRCEKCNEYCIHLLTNKRIINVEEYIITKSNSTMGFKKEEI